MNNTWLVAKREVTTRLRQRSFILGTFLLAFLIVVSGGVFRLIANSLDDTDKPIALTPAVSQLRQTVEQLVPGTDIVELPDSAVPKEVALHGYQDKPVLFVIDGTPEKPVFVSNGDPDPAIVAAIGTATRNAELVKLVSDMGGNVSQVQQVIVQSQPEVVNVDDSGSIFSADFDVKTFTLGILISTLLLFAILFGGVMLATGVVEEKSSRVIEILLASVKPVALLTGKILGISILVFIQLTIYVIAAIAGLALADHLDLLEGSWQGSLALFIIWLVLGFLTYAIMFGSLSSLVSRQEEIGTITAPLTILAMVPFYLGIYLVPYQPDSIWVKVLSYVPLFSPYMMPMRYAIGGSIWSQLVAIVITLVTLPLLAYIGGRIYRNSILRMGGTVKISDAWKNSPSH